MTDIVLKGVTVKVVY